MWISPAYAQDAAGGSAAIVMQLLPLILIFAVFYFLLIRPQQKKMKDHREMLGKLKRNDRVITGGGIVGTISKVRDDSDEIEVEIAPGTRVTVLRGTITSVLQPPAAANDPKPAVTKG
ncbi:preprotein translocase subunit YajC [Roseomonas sp. AR75]|jgi:preprotein translocase subunit YajC|uniref:preprotein translocase subunit YajC n=1 Tax=Roseomonas sp. AR75 TaxID=2562311 RepID=UPI0010C07479|nr:preprotein translocase subunit YajC [Roseomonas sp. AR75]